MGSSTNGEPECIRLGPGETLAQRRIMEVLTSSVKRRVLAHLITDGPLTAKDLATRLGVSLPTVLEHLELLVASGLVRVEGSPLSGKRYAIAVGCVDMRVSIKNHARSDEDALRRLAIEYLRSAGRGIKLPVRVREVARRLGVDRHTAAQVAALLNNDPSLISGELEHQVEEALSTSRPKTLSELARELGVDASVVAMVVMKLVETGRVQFAGGGVVKRPSMDGKDKRLTGSR